ncbi:hypothetical protein ILUMI_11100 [Ignelater luminosus]|uniref:Uncharacterized protein n=1 Tax=Ignelater luminosus TaxID=2038154 RepID=A0A8K0D0T0_IGNLU|nr:hypothetical protein ILUMI_11100 [Ignelater luminosus]
MTNSFHLSSADRSFNTGGNQKTSVFSKLSGNNIVIPREVRPLPKAPPRKIGGRGRGRKPGTTRILIITLDKSKLIEDCPILTHGDNGMEISSSEEEKQSESQPLMNYDVGLIERPKDEDGE